ANIPNLVGHTIDNGRLLLTALVGSGSNGVIFLAADNTSRSSCPTRFAVKCLVRADRDNRLYAVQRQEVLFHKMMSGHPNVLTLHRVIEESHYLFLVMDYCPGGDFFTFLAERTHFHCIGRTHGSKPYSTRANDVWALGVVLTSMISGHNPWTYASVLNDCYSAYLADANFLRKMLPISCAANIILRRIFTKDASRRITIPQLRRLIIRTDTFFMSDVEIANGNDHLKEAAASYFQNSQRRSIKRPREDYSCFVGASPIIDIRTSMENREEILQVLRSDSERRRSLSDPESSSSVNPERSPQTIDDGRLQLVELLGEGAYGVVYRAIDKKSASSSSNPNPKEYAVKVLVKAEPLTRQWRYQKREVATHTRVSEHPNIVTMHQVLEDDWFVYIVLDYCPGGDLYDAICERFTYCRNDELVKKVFVQLLDAVGFCHGKGIFHRDLKPDNIFVNEDGTELRLGDFGLATNTRMTERFGCGSSYYMSPECIGDEYNYRMYSTQASDVWALGVILTNMIAGRNPWNYATTSDKCFLRYVADPDHLREMLPISEAASQILQSIFTLDPRIRITIPALRERILNIETFFMSEDEIKKSNKFVKMAARDYVAPKPKTCVSQNTAFFRDGIYPQSPNSPLIIGRRQHEIVLRENSSFVSSSGISSGYSSTSSSSGEESEEPITPSTYAQDPADIVDVPEMLEGEGLGVVIVPVEKKHSEMLPTELQSVRVLV
ncbi:Negative regulator of sexual conjugation and meiosis, partial [Grifola frondosa]